MRVPGIVATIDKGHRVNSLLNSELSANFCFAMRSQILAPISEAKGIAHA
jgi:hypothetical protein